VLLALPTSEVLRQGLISNRGMVVVATAFGATYHLFPERMVSNAIERYGQQLFGYASHLHLGWMAGAVTLTLMLVTLLLIMRALSMALALLQFKFGQVAVGKCAGLLALPTCTPAQWHAERQAPGNAADIFRLALHLQADLHVAMATAACQCDPGFGRAQALRCSAYIAAFGKRDRRCTGAHILFNVGPWVIGAQGVACFEPQQQGKFRAGCAQGVLRLARLVGHGEVVCRQTGQLQRRHRAGGNLMTRRAQRFGRGLQIVLGELCKLFGCLQLEVVLVQSQLLQALRVQQIQMTGLQAGIGLCGAQAALAAALPGPFQPQRAVDALVLPTSAADAMMRADLAAADGELGLRAQACQCGVGVCATHLGSSTKQFGIAFAHELARVGKTHRSCCRREQQCAQQDRAASGKIHPHTVRCGTCAPLSPTFRQAFDAYSAD